MHYLIYFSQSLNKADTTIVILTLQVKISGFSLQLSKDTEQESGLAAPLLDYYLLHSGVS